MSEAGRHPVDELAERFAERIRAGQRPSVEQFAAEYPEHAAMIRLMFPGIEMVERLRARDESRRLGSPRQPAVPETLGDFRLLREIGRGGMGVIYEAVQQSLGRHVALKVIGAIHAGSGRHRERFRREAEAVAGLHHTNIVALFGTGEDRGLQFHAMQLIQGVSLDAWIDHLRSGRGDHAEPGLSSADADAVDEIVGRIGGAPGAAYDRHVARWVATIAAALEYAHGQGVLHRDIKPSNLILDREGTVWLTDFGLASREASDRMTQTGELVGTLRYMAPEQLRGEFDARGDVYCLGLTLYELLTLRPAIGGSTAELLHGNRQRMIPAPRGIRPDLAKDLETIVIKACAADPSHRYASAGDLERDLRRFLEDRPIAARRVTPPERLWRWSRRNPAVATMGGATLALLIAIAGLLGWMNRQKQRDLETIAAEYARAETNLGLAMEAFETIIENIAARGVAESLLEEFVDVDDWATDADVMLTDADVRLLTGLLDFFDRFAEENAADLRGKSAAARRRVGDIQQRLGRLADAERSYADALATYRSLAKLDPHDPAWLLQQAGVLNELMRIAAGRGRLGEARKLFETTESLIASFTSGSSATSPRDSREVRFLLAKTLSIVVSFELRGVNPDPKRRPIPGRFRRSTGPNRSEPGDDGTPRVRRAAEANGRALELVGSLLAEDPGNVAYRTALAMAHRDGAKIDRAGGRPDDAAGHRAAAIALLERIAKEYPNSAAIQYQLAEVLLDGSVLGIARGGGFGISAVDAVAEDLTRVIRISESLIAGQPDSIPYRALYATAQIRLAAAHAAAGRPQRALTTLRSSIEAQQTLVDRSPEVILHRITLAQSLRNLAELEANRGDREAAMKTLDRAIATIERTVQERPSRPFLYSLLKRLRDRRESVLNP